MSRYGSLRRSLWGREADRVLAALYHDHDRPSPAQIRDAYPFGQRKHHPYRVWLARVHAWGLQRQVLDSRGREPAESPGEPQ